MLNTVFLHEVFLKACFFGAKKSHVDLWIESADVQKIWPGSVTVRDWLAMEHGK